MRPFSKLYVDFWINPDNTKLMQLGANTKLLAIYLQGNSHQNMLGVYYLPTLYIANDLKQSVQKIQSTLQNLCDISYCKYDAKTQYIWVCNMALEQIGEEISAKDNRTKAIQAIWDSLPIQIDFLSDVHNKYSNIFNLKCRFDGTLHRNKATNNLSTGILVDTAEKSLNVGVSTKRITNSASVINNNCNLEKELSVDNHFTSIFPATDLSLNLTIPFEGVKKPLQSSPMLNNGCDSNKIDMLAHSSKVTRIAYENCFTVTDHSTIFDGSLNLVNGEYDKTKKVGLYLSKEINGLTDVSKKVSYPFEAPQKDLRSPSKAPSEALQSNIEYISKNIEERNKKKETEEDFKKEKKEKKKEVKPSNVLIPNIVVQARPVFEEKPSKFNLSVLKDTKSFKAFELQRVAELEAGKHVEKYREATVASEFTNPPKWQEKTEQKETTEAVGVIEVTGTVANVVKIATSLETPAFERKSQSGNSVFYSRDNFDQDATKTNSILFTPENPSPAKLAAIEIANAETEAKINTTSNTKITLKPNAAKAIDATTAIACSDVNKSNSAEKSKKVGAKWLKRTDGNNAGVAKCAFSDAALTSPAAVVSTDLSASPTTVFSAIDTSSDVIAVIFEHWKKTMKHPRSHLDCKRSSLIRKALRMGYSVQDLFDAITGCSLTPHNTGTNDHRQRYDGLHIILDNADQIDRFIDNCHHPPKPFTTAHQRFQSNVIEADDWVTKKLGKSTNNTNSGRSEHV